MSKSSVSLVGILWQNLYRFSFSFIYFLFFEENVILTPSLSLKHRLSLFQSVFGGHWKLIFGSYGFPRLELSETFSLSCKGGKNNLISKQKPYIHQPAFHVFHFSFFLLLWSNFFSHLIFLLEQQLPTVSASLFVPSEMKSSTRLDSAVFQLTPTRTR